jgi:cephalosporin hydroxylase
MGFLEAVRSRFRRWRYGLLNWRFASESARLRGAGAPSKEDVRATTDAFHRLFYETGYAKREGWSNPRWMGVETWKCPLDLWVYQEIVAEVRPDLIVECGTAYGGSALFLAGVLDALGSGRVLSIDITRRDGRPRHPRVEFLLGSSTAPEIVDRVRAAAAGARVLVILDSDHRQAHVARELSLYAPLVGSGSYVIVEDTNINGHPVFEGFGPGPAEAVEDFLRAHPEFEADRSRERFLLTFHPGGYLRRR